MLSLEPFSFARCTRVRAALSRSSDMVASAPPVAAALAMHSRKSSAASSSSKASQRPSLAMIIADPEASTGSMAMVQTSGTQLTPTSFKWWSPRERETLSEPPTRPCRTMPPSATTRLVSSGSPARWSTVRRRQEVGPTSTALESPTLPTWSVRAEPRRCRSDTVAVQPLFQAPSMASWLSTFLKESTNTFLTSAGPDTQALSSFKTKSCSFDSQ
mmetsp:Transcript_108013/g.344866  ORF Transcript_108013/g.344866 Transcript_108013/m.344866 type:complete len:215 (+) Transcript_108013:205-849(+)